MFKYITDESEIDVPIMESIPTVSAKNKSRKKIHFGFNIEILDLFCKYSTELKNKYITRASLLNLRNLLEITDTKFYERDDSQLTRIEYAILALEARLDYGLNTFTLILRHIKRNIKRPDIVDKEIVPLIKEMELSKATLDYTNTMIYDYLTEGYSVEYSKRLADLFTDRESGEFKSMKEFSTAFQSILIDIQTDMREATAYDRSRESFSLGKGFDNFIKDTVDRLKSPTNKYKVGIKYLNRMLGGLESGRVYLFMGVTGVGKSVVLLTIANHLRKYNAIEPKDPTKRATVLYITQENSEDETIERLFNMTVSNKDIREFNPEEVSKLMKEKGGLTLQCDNDIDLVIKYYDNRAISANGIDNVISDMESEGKEVVAVVQDYIGRLACTKKCSELRHELGEVANELHNVAVRRGIPIITAAQLNRAASSIVDDMIANNEADTAKKLGKQNAAESFSMIQNVDVVVVISKEYDKSDEDNIRTYMGFNLAKFRGKPPKGSISYFVHPFKEGNDILLLEDESLEKSYSKFSMKDVINPMRMQVNAPANLNIQQNMLAMSSQFMQDCGFYTTDKLAMIEANATKERAIERLMKQKQQEDALIKLRQKQLLDGLKSNKYNVTDDSIKVSSRKKKTHKIIDGLIVISSRKKKSIKNIDGLYHIGSRNDRKVD